MVCLLIMCAVCRSTPIYLHKRQAIDLSIVASLTAVLLHGPYVAVIIYALSSFFMIEIDPDSGKRLTIYNTPITKTLFNLSNLVISIFIPGFMLRFMGFVPGAISIPWLLLAMCVFTLLSYALNCTLLSIIFLLNGEITAHDAWMYSVSMLPNVLFAMPLGLFGCIVLIQDGGFWVAPILLSPLMLARQSLNLYRQSKNQHYTLIKAFISAVEAKDKYTEGHSRRVARYARLIAQTMRLRAATVETIGIAALLHDIGKLAIPDAILCKPGILTADEYLFIQKHPVIGVGIVDQVGLSPEITEIILNHHERYDGFGYPNRLSGVDLSIGAQILAVADAFDAMTSARPYREAMPVQQAAMQLKQERGKQFNPEIVDYFLPLITSSAVLKEVLRTDGSQAEGVVDGAVKSPVHA